MTTSTNHRKHYTVTDTGPIPDDWPDAIIMDVSTFVSNGFVGSCLEHQTDDPAGVLYLQGFNVRENRLDFNNITRVTRQFHAAQKKTKLQAGDVLVVQSGHIGTTAVVPKDLEEANCHALIITRLDESKVNPYFVSHYLNSHIGKSRMRGLEVGSGITHINTKDLKKFRIPLPPKHEQDEIAAILSDYDCQFETINRLIETKREHKRALMQRLLTGKLRFPEFAGSEWRKAHIDELLKQVKRPVQWDDNAEYKLISVRRRSGGLFVREVLRGEQILTKKMNTAKAGDFLISKMQVVHGAMGLTTAEFDGMNISDSYIALVARDPNVLDMEFFDWLSRSRDMYHRAYRSSYGVHIEKMTFNLDLFLTEKVSFPSSIVEQRKIAAVLSAADREIDQLTQKLDAYKQQKKGLMQQLLTGKKRVKLDHKEAA